MMKTVNGIILLKLTILLVGAWWIIFTTPPFPNGINTKEEFFFYIIKDGSELKDLFVMSCIVICVSMISSLFYFFSNSVFLLTLVLILLIAQAVLGIMVMGWENGVYFFIPVGIGLFPILSSNKSTQPTPKSGTAGF